MKQIESAEGKLGILIPGIGAVATTLITGVLAAREGIALPVGSLTQMGRIRLGKRTENRNPLIRDFVPLASLDDIVFGGWDLFEDSAYQAALKANVLDKHLVEYFREELSSVRPMKAVFDPAYIPNLKAVNIKMAPTKMDLANELISDIENFRVVNKCSRLVMVWCASTEAFTKPSAAHQSVEALEEGLRNNDPSIPPSMIYAYASVKSGIPYANGSPNLSCDVPAIVELATMTGIPIGGKDYKSGQTFMKTMLAPGLKARLLGLDGWFSTNILGNRDGEVLNNPENFRTKEVSKSGVIDDILEPQLYPDLYGNVYHKVRIEYYPPRGDFKESWDNLDIFGWLGYKMQIKINFSCRDSILAAPLALDIALFLDLAKRSGMKGIQEWLSFYFKSPQTAQGLPPQNDVFKQLEKLENTLRYLKGEDLITHLGLDYYEELYGEDHATIDKDIAGESV
ncbi:MAG TPA: inositol-3-phosphate synthase [Bacteroidales bacterium]|nr:inositol-3-phosphate synthase [Bacteroidales bacterium]